MQVDAPAPTGSDHQQSPSAAPGQPVVRAQQKQAARAKKQGTKRRTNNLLVVDPADDLQIRCVQQAGNESGRANTRDS
jgi:hypothetical protein